MSVEAKVLTSQPTIEKPREKQLPPPQTKLIMGGSVVGLILLFYLAMTQTIEKPILFVIGILLGYTLFHARFGFTSAFRRFASVGNGEALRAHMIMLIVAVTFFAPILATGFTFFGGEDRKSVV